MFEQSLQLWLDSSTTLAAHVRGRILVGYLGLVVVVLAALEIPLGVQFGRSEQRTLETKVEHDATTIASIAPDTLRRADRRRLQAIAGVAYRYRGDTGGRVVIVNRKGVAVIDTNARGPGVTSFASRPEIASALRGNVASGTRGTRRRCTRAPLRRGAGRGQRAVGRGRPDHLSDVGSRLAHPALLARARRDRGDRGRRRRRRRPRGRDVHRETAAAARGRRGRRRRRRLTRAGARTRGPAGGALAGRGVQRDGGEARPVAALAGGVRRRRVAPAQDAAHGPAAPAREPRARTSRAGRAELDGAVAEVDRPRSDGRGLLALARADTGREPAGRVDVDLVARERVERWRALADERGISLSRRPRCRRRLARHARGSRRCSTTCSRTRSVTRRAAARVTVSAEEARAVGRAAHPG